MSSINSKLAQAIVPLLTVSLLAMGCSESTAPSPGDGATGDSPAQLPNGTSNTSAGNDQLPNPVPGAAPKTDGPGSLDSIKPSPKPSLLRLTREQHSSWAPSSGLVNVPAGAVGCMGYPLRNLVVKGIGVGRTWGPSETHDQYVTAVFGFYRYSGGKWNYVSSVQTGVNLKATSFPQIPSPWAMVTLPEAPALPNLAGQYMVTVRLTWWAWLGGTIGWLQTASADYDLNAPSEYSANMNARVYSGSCIIG